MYQTGTTSKQGSIMYIYIGGFDRLEVNLTDEHQIPSLNTYRRISCRPTADGVAGSSSPSILDNRKQNSIVLQGAQLYRFPPLRFRTGELLAASSAPLCSFRNRLIYSMFGTAARRALRWFCKLCLM